MKSEDILKQDKISEDECDVCALHDKAQEVLNDEILCPRCDKPLKGGGAGYNGFVVVGSHNAYDKDEPIGKYPLYHCNDCGNDFQELYALMPIPIKWNANHDIFYTGGSHFLMEDTSDLDTDVEKEILASIEQYTERIRDGENQLRPWNLLIWIQYAIHGAIANFLYKNGYKK